MKILSAMCLWWLPLAAAAQPNTDLHLFDLSVRANTVVLSRLRNVTPHPGYDNQPFFHASLPLLYYASSDNNGRTDLKIYNYRTAQTQPLTTTPEREYSPTLTENHRFVSCIIQRDNGQQDLGRYPIAGGPPTVLVDFLKVGYHAWADTSRLLVYALAEPVSELHYLDLATRRDTIVARNVGRSLKRIPGQPAISFLEKTPQGTWAIKRFDTQTLVITTIGEALAGSEDLAWTRNGLMLMSNGTSIQFRRPGGKKGWQPVKMRGKAQPLNHATRLAVNPANDRLAVVVDE